MVAFNTAVATPEKASLQGGGIVPQGVYTAMITGEELLQNDSGWQGVKLTFQIVGGDFDGRKVTTLCSIAHATNQKCVDIGLETIGKIGRAIGLDAVSNTTQLLNKPIGIIVEHREDGEYTRVEAVKFGPASEVAKAQEVYKPYKPKPSAAKAAVMESDDVPF